MLLQVDEKQANEFHKHEHEQDIAQYQREVDASHHELTQVEQFYSHAHEKHQTQAKHNDVLCQLEVLT
jgi:hypothetical protein